MSGGGNEVEHLVIPKAAKAMATTRRQEGDGGISKEKVGGCKEEVVVMVMAMSMAVAAKAALRRLWQCWRRGEDGRRRRRGGAPGDGDGGCGEGEGGGGGGDEDAMRRRWRRQGEGGWR